MTQEEKQLLLKDLSARLSYGVMVSVQGGEFDSYKYPYRLTAVSKFGLDSFCKVYNSIYTPFGVPNVEDVKPYLRSMSSMTEEEEIYYNTIYVTLKFYEKEDWLNEHHFDYRIDPLTGKTLIESNLAIEAPEGMYKL